MEEQSKTLAVSVRAKEFVSYHCSCCGHCCRHIENCVMVESLDAYRMAKHLRNQHCGISSTDDVLLRYCEPMPLTDEGYPIYVLKTVGADATCIFLRENQCSIYAARPRTCRLYPFSVGLVSVDGILNTACALMIISSITSTAERYWSKTGCTTTFPKRTRNF